MFKGLSLKNIFKFIALIAVITIIYLIIAMVFTNWFTRHGASVKVPKVTGMPAEKAFKLLDDEALEMIIVDSVYKEDMKPMTIVEQDPLPLMNVKPGRLIYVTINTGIKPKVKMPSLINGGSNLATVLLQNSGLRLGRVDSVKSTLGTGLVIHQKYKGKDILPNTMLEKGAIIDIVVSKSVSRLDSTAIKNMGSDGVLDENDKLHLE
jgi:eukaryotic-like serine/threonine-protein kinase